VLNKRLIAHFDGGTFVGGIYWGYQVWNEGKLYSEQNGFSQHYKTNNEAEYTALNKLLESLNPISLSRTSYEIYGDSKLVIEQMKGNWLVKANNLLPLWRECSNGFLVDNINYHHCSREEPLQKKVDKWARKALPKEETSKYLYPGDDLVKKIYYTEELTKEERGILFNHDTPKK
tara:strand:- start:1279 stop:1803 length:525 start_codon:yes stop_codon:yes gene_type:complete